jgi:hypothetical protein
MSKLFIVGGSCLAVVFILMGLTGWVFYTNATEDPLRRADAIIVLAGEHDGREQYGLQLLRDGIAPFLLLSNPYPATDTAMQSICRTHIEKAEIQCRRPDPETTRGEAILTRRLAQESGWKTVVVVTWRFHLPRAKAIFEKCFSDAPGALIMRGVPRKYDYSPAHWEFTYLYQDVGMTKNFLQDDCVNG